MPSPVWKRLLLFGVAIVACLVGYLFLLHVPVLSLAGPTAGVIPVLLLATATFWLNDRFLRVDGLSLAEIGLDLSPRRPAQFACGFLAGSCLAMAWLAIVTLVTGARWNLNPTFQALSLLGACAFAFFNNTAEELTYRGYAFVRLADTVHPAFAVLATTGVFALLHLQAGIPWLAVLAGVLTSGLIFAVLFARWRSLPLALGFHVATNVVQDVSGLRLSPASFFAPAYPPALGPESAHTIFASTAALNLVVALAIACIPRRPAARDGNEA